MSTDKMSAHSGTSAWTTNDNAPYQWHVKQLNSYSGVLPYNTSSILRIEVVDITLVVLI